MSIISSVLQFILSPSQEIGSSHLSFSFVHGRLIAGSESVRLSGAEVYGKNRRFDKLKSHLDADKGQGETNLSIYNSKYEW